MRQSSSPVPKQPHKCCNFLDSKEGYDNHPEFKYGSRSFVREFAFSQCYTRWDRPPTEDTYGGSRVSLENRSKLSKYIENIFPSPGRASVSQAVKNLTLMSCHHSQQLPLPCVDPAQDCLSLRHGLVWKVSLFLGLHMSERDFPVPPLTATVQIFSPAHTS